MMMLNYKIVVCASCGGGLFKVLLDNSKAVGYDITKLIVNKECGAIDIANAYGIEVVQIPVKNNSCFVEEFINAIPVDTNLIVLAGYLPIIPPEVCERYERKIINVHPSLLPKYGGKGMYSVKVQEAVMANYEKYGGCTVHYVSKDIDKGEIISQEKIEIDYSLSPWELGGKVFEISTVALIKSIKKIMNL